jgi:hypothetical protein
MKVYEIRRTRLVTEVFSVFASSEDEAFDVLEGRCGESDDCIQTEESTISSDAEIRLIDEV